MADAALLLTTAISGLFRFVLRRRARVTAGAGAATKTGADTQAGTDASAMTDAVRRERLVERAFLAGAVPAVWYRHAKASLAAEAEEADRTRG